MSRSGSPASCRASSRASVSSISSSGSLTPAEIRRARNASNAASSKSGSRSSASYSRRLTSPRARAWCWASPRRSANRTMPGDSISGLDAEAMRGLRPLEPLLAGVLDDGVAGARPHRLHEPCELGLAAHRLGLDAAVGQVPHPAGHAQLGGAPRDEMAEAHALD